jgi:hypothetical protein
MSLITNETLLQSITELTTAIKAANERPNDFDMDVLKAAFGPMLADLYKEQNRKRWGEQDEMIMPDGSPKKIVQSGKFKGWDALDLYILKRAMEVSPSKGPSEELMKAMDSTTDGSGDDFVPTLEAAQLWEQVYLESKIAQALGPIIQMPSNPYHIPLWSTFTWYKGSENTATTASNPTTSQSIMTATEILAEVDWSYTLDEDSIVPMMGNLRTELVRSAAEQLDYFLLNADATNAATGNINLDDADPADTKVYLSDGQDGLRHYWLVDDTAQGVNAGGDALSDADILSALALMGKYAINPKDCFMIVDAQTYFKGLLNLDSVQTLDKFGPGAVVLTGQLAAYRGIPIIVSESASLTEADGKVSTTAGNNTLGQVTMASRRMWKVGTWRNLLIEVDKDIQKRQTIMVASFRPGIAAYDRTSDHGSGIRNILV